MNRIWKLRDGTALFTAVFLLSLQARTHATEFDEVNALFKTKQYDAAHARATEFLSNHPGDAQMRLMQGLILGGLNRQTDAIAILTSLTKDFPDLAEPYNNLAVVYAGAGMYDNAIAVLKKAIQADPGYTTAYENLADLYAKLAHQAKENAVKVNTGSTSARARHSQQPQTIALRRTASGQSKGEQPAADGNDDRQLLLTLVQDWAKAWSARDVNAYLGYYGPQFQPQKFEPRATWEARRHKLILNKKTIQVTIQAPQVFISSSTATVRFLQKYVSDNYSASTRKTLIFRKYEDGWKIVEERSNDDLNGLPGPS